MKGLKVKWLDKISEREIKDYGIKSFSLSKLIKKDFPVPEGFVIPNTVFRDFLERNNISGKGPANLVRTSRLRNDLIDQVSRFYNNLTLSKEIEGIKQVKFLSRDRARPSVIIRPSPYGEFSYTGQFRSVPNVRGINRVLNEVKACWASYFSERVKKYQKLAKDEPKLGLLIQKFINSSKSGSAFTVNPLTGKEMVLIEGVGGLGLSLSKGEVIPSFFHLDKESLDLKRKIQNEQKWMDVIDLNGNIVKRSVTGRIIKEEELLRIGELAKKIESVFGEPVYLEWVMKRGNPWIVQVETLTTEKTGDVGLEEAEGYGMSPGSVSGIARRMDNLVKGNILITNNLSSRISLVLDKVKGVVAYSGGLGSAGARVCREFSIPCVVQNRVEVQEGKHITLNGQRGIVSKEKEIKEKEKEIMAKLGVIVTTPGEALSPEYLINEKTEFVNINLQKLAEHSFEEVSDLTHPSLIKQVKLLTEFCKERGIKTNLLIPRYDQGLLEKFSKLGVNYISTGDVRLRNQEDHKEGKEKISEEGGPSST